MDTNSSIFCLICYLLIRIYTHNSHSKLSQVFFQLFHFLIHSNLRLIYSLLQSLAVSELNFAASKQNDHLASLVCFLQDL